MFSVPMVLIDSSSFAIYLSLPLQCTADSGPRPGVSWFKIPTFTAPDTLLFQVCHPWSMMNGARGQAGPIQQFVEKYVQYLDDRLPPFQEKMSLPPSPAPTDRWKTFFSFASYSTGTSFGVGVCNTLAIIEKFIVSRPTLFNVSCCSSCYCLLCVPHSDCPFFRSRTARLIQRRSSEA